MATKIGWTPPPPRRDYHTGITGAPERTGVHVRHCCQVHGCKYGYDDCPVVDCTAQQSGPCEDCFNDIEVWQAVEQTRSVNGVVGVLWRISDALRKARNGSDPSAVADAIKNPRTANKKVTDDNLEG